jgi:hypothetical protein
MRDVTCSMALQKQLPRRPALQRLRGARSRSQPESTATRRSSTSAWYPGNQRSVHQGSGTTPGLAAEAYAAVQAAKYAHQDNFIPLILETGGRVDKATRDWLDTLTAPEPDEQVPSQDDHPWNPQTRTTTETVLREAMQALVRVQAHVLARIVVEIRAADLVVVDPACGTGGLND